MIRRIAIPTLCISLAALAPVAAQRPNNSDRPAPAATTPPRATGDTSSAMATIRRLRWRSVGPANNAGRVSVVVGVPGNRDVYYVAGANGGIIKTTNGGVTFRPIFDRQNISSIGAIAIAPSDPNVIYVGTGEENPRNNASIGDGMYKSVDAGEHWTKIGLDKTDKIARIAIDAKNPDLVYVCGLGREWGPNEERGVFKTTDGGKSWKKILYVDPQTACSDVAIDPGNSNIVYAGMYTYRRWAWHLESGGGNTAVYRSVNGGETWERLSGKDRDRGLPKGDMDRIGIAVAASDPDVVYVVSETKTEGELWRSDDGGDHWRTVNRDPNINFRPFYYSDIRVDPQNPNRVFSLSGSLYLSEDGGANFRTIARDVHGDHQALWIDPTNPKYILSGSDGGWQVSYDGSRNFEVVNTFPFTQFYHINYDMQKPYMVCGGLQDNGNWCGPSQTTSGQGNRKNDWFTVSGGDGFFTVPVMDKPWLVYSDAQGGMLNITDTRSGTQKTIYPYPNRVGSVGDAMISHKYRFNWNSPIAPSPVDSNVIWVGTDDGNVQVTRDGGKTWSNVFTNVAGLKPNAWIPTVDASHSDAGTAYVAADHHQDDDYAPYAFMTTDYGKTWRKITGDLPVSAAWTHVVREDPRNRNLLYIGTEMGVWASWDKGVHWMSIRGDLPPTPVRDIQVHPRDNDLLLATHGRGLYVMDDISALQNLGAAQTADATLFDIRPATRWVQWSRDGNLGQKKWTGENPPAGALITYFLKTQPSGEVNITISDKDGRTVRRLRRVSDDAGLNRVAWDLRTDAPPGTAGGGRGGRGGGGGGGAQPGAADADTSLAAVRARRAAAQSDAEQGAGDEGGGGGGGRGGGGGLDVLPGTYTVAVSVNGRQLTKPVQVQLDPRSDMTAAQLATQNQTAAQLNDILARVNRVITGADDLLAQLTSLQTQLRREQGGGGGVVQQGQVLGDVDGAIKDLRQFRDSVLARPLPGLGYRQYPRLREEAQTVAGMVSRPMMPPTAGELLRMNELRTEADQAQARLDAIVSGRITKINQSLAGTPHVITPSRPVIP